MARLLSVNVGLPREIEWRGRRVYTGIWKSPAPGRSQVRRLNIAGDGQGDRAGHGGEQRAVFVYQIESYRYWGHRLGRTDFVFGQFGENFTVEGMPDDAVCIGDRYRIGSAVFEVTQPRVTCYRVGIRMNEPHMAALLTSSGRTGFYFRVLQEGDVGAGDEIVRIAQAGERLSVSVVNALLYSDQHPRAELERALRVEALALGWRSSFQALLNSAGSSGNAGLAPETSAQMAEPGFFRFRVTAIDQQSADVLSLTVGRADGSAVPAWRPGQYVVLRFGGDGGRVHFRSFSLSGPPGASWYRLGVKIEPDGLAGAYLGTRVQLGDEVELSAPRGRFTLQSGQRPLVLLSAGIGVTPVLAMLHVLAAEHSTRSVLWLHCARDSDHHPFAAEARGLLQTLADSRSYICYSRPKPGDRAGHEFDASGRLSQLTLAAAGITQDAEVYLCGPEPFMRQIEAALAATGVPSERIHVERFGGGESKAPGIVSSGALVPHPPPDQVSAGAVVSFSRSGISARWDSAKYGSILELAEACDVRVRWSCRSGICHSCESGLVSGTVAYGSHPLDMPARGNVLICSAQPEGDVVIDL